MTVASVHERLYQEDGAKAADARIYLLGLVEDLAHLSPERSITLHAPVVVLPAERLSALGLVTAELVTNALKYGRGAVVVRLAADEKDILRLAVEDEGDGFPDTFPKPQGTGLGMRLVMTYAGTGPDAIVVDRSVPFSRIVVRFRAARA
jgi:two-component sensor histidine kinase